MRNIKICQVHFRCEEEETDIDEACFSMAPQSVLGKSAGVLGLFVSPFWNEAQ